MLQIYIFLCSLALAKAGIIGTDYSPATSVSSVYSSINTPVATKTLTAPVVKTYSPITYTKTYTAPAPVYESVLSTHEGGSKLLDGTQYNTFAKSLDTPYGNFKKFESRTYNDGIFVQNTPTLYSTPVHSSSVVSHTDSHYSSPVYHSVSSPVTYTTHSQAAPVYTKTISTPAVATYSSPVVTKTVTPGLSSYASPGLSTYTSHTPVVQAHPTVKITYSEAPLVSHMTFTGLGTSYSW